MLQWSSSTAIEMPCLSLKRHHGSHPVIEIVISICKQFLGGLSDAEGVREADSKDRDSIFDFSAGAPAGFGAGGAVGPACIPTGACIGKKGEGSGAEEDQTQYLSLQRWQKRHAVLQAAKCHLLPGHELTVTAHPLRLVKQHKRHLTGQVQVDVVVLRKPDVVLRQRISPLRLKPEMRINAVQTNRREDIERVDVCRKKPNIRSQNFFRSRQAHAESRSVKRMK